MTKLFLSRIFLRHSRLFAILSLVKSLVSFVRDNKLIFLVPKYLEKSYYFAPLSTKRDSSAQNLIFLGKFDDLGERCMTKLLRRENFQ